MNLFHKIYAFCAVIFAGGLILSTTGCNTIFDSGSDIDEQGFAFLKINVDLLESMERTKGDDEIEDPLLPNEKMHTLRIIILHNNGEIEKDSLIRYNDPAISSGKLTFRVTSNDRKRIYLIANEAQLPRLNLDEANFSEQALTDYVWTGEIDGDKPLPQSAAYHLVVPSSYGTIEKNYHLVRTMTKFTFTFESSRPMKVTVDELEVGSLANQSYVMPHFYNVDEQMQKTPVANSADFVIKDMFWIDWLKTTSEQSHYISQMDKLDWFYDYDLPANTDHKIFSKKGLNIDVTAAKPDTLVFYAHESKYVPTGETAQKYVINKLKIKDYSESATNPKEITFDLNGGYKEALELPKVKALFRNTHVIVRVIFSTNDLYIYARIMPWNDWMTEGNTPPYDKLIEIVD
ncbi:MAG: hypothetical protein HUJ92_04720 [Bacteroidales bacterium]|nr:hypothetical protein [Bacteroidales bacterium]